MTVRHCSNEVIDVFEINKATLKEVTDELSDWLSVHEENYSYINVSVGLDERVFYLLTIYAYH